MIYGEYPSFDEILKVIEQLDNYIYIYKYNKVLVNTLYKI